MPSVFRETWDAGPVDAPHSPHTSGGPGWCWCTDRDDRLDAFDAEDATYTQKAELELPFAMRFLRALEEVLDPIVTMLDCLPAHLDPKLAPLESLNAMADWLGLPFEEGVPRKEQQSEHQSTDKQERLRRERQELRDRQQRLVENALEISRSRGTKRGLELLLELMFGEPNRPEKDRVFKINDGGYCVVGSAPPPDADRPEPGTFVVQWTQPLDEHVEAAVKRLVDREKPVNVRCDYHPPEQSQPQVHVEMTA